jgi:adenosine deaminase CECR1
MNRVVVIFLSCFFIMNAHAVDDMDKWFRQFKQQADAKTLYRLLWALPKGGDLHHHLSGAGYSEWWFDLATDTTTNGGYTYYTKIKINQCSGYGSDEFGPNPQYLLFKTIQASRYEALSACEKQEYTLVANLTDEQKQAFLNSIRLDKPHEGRDEFFQTHWRRLNDLTANPTLMAHILLKNMQAYQREGLQYLETQVNVQGKLKADGSQYTPEETLAIFTDMLASPEAQATGVQVRFQYALLRFLPNAENRLAWMYDFVDQHRDIYVGINMVGREDNDKGYPLRFLAPLRKLRVKYPAIPLAIHAGEVDEPNLHVKDTLLLGADRIGHGLNTITDPDTLLLMRHGPYLIEINLISNLLLEYVDDFSTHPFPEYLRTGIPVALSTDDRGMWDSRLTDEYFVAVNEFNLSWHELTQLAANSLAYSFLSATEKQQQLTMYWQKIRAFEQKLRSKKALPPLPEQRLFMCQYQPSLCQ